MTKRRQCPSCKGPKDFYAKLCRRCAPGSKSMLGRYGANHPSWRGGGYVNEEGYVYTYAPNHPWPRKNPHVLEHVRVMELHIGRRILPDEVVHHLDHDRKNNDLSNLELKKADEHSREHRREDGNRGPDGRFIPMAWMAERVPQ